MDNLDVRLRRATIINIVVVLGFTGLFIFLLWSLRALVLPISVGFLIAYACFPVLKAMRRRGLSRGVAIVILVGVFSIALFLLAYWIQSLNPDEKGQLELRVVMQYKIDKAYRRLTGSDSSEPSIVYRFLGADLDPMLDKIDDTLFLSDQERTLFRMYREGYKNAPPVTDRVFGYHVANMIAYKGRLAERYAALELANQDPDALRPEAKHIQIPWLQRARELASVWVVTPLFFLFLLLDDGEIKRNLIRLLPNQYLELSVAVIERVNYALGRYLRGTIIESALVGLVVIVGYLLLGFRAEWAIILGTLAGLLNVIPFVGLIVASVAAAAYALIADDITPVLPFIRPENVVVWVIVVLVGSHLVDTIVFQPVVLGSSAHLHPLVIVSSVVGGAILFGIAGMLFAIPTVMVLKVIYGSLMSQLKAYYII
ncbi:MAG: AI-2E family transporter [Candidatus Lambdaproteobacteria bacterium]|nr:AI-2E family transporter [Candidatus Lambdaproteobacteria bacterium]